MPGPKDLEECMAEPSENMPKFTLAVEGRKGEAVRLSISGHILLDNLVPFRSGLESFLSKMAPASVTVDLAGVEYVDSGAALALLDLKGEAETLSIPFKFLDATEKTRGVIGLIDPEAITMAPLRTEEHPPDFFTQIGDDDAAGLEGLLRPPVLSGRPFILPGLLFSASRLSEMDGCFLLYEAGRSGRSPHPQPDESGNRGGHSFPLRLATPARGSHPICGGPDCHDCG